MTGEGRGRNVVRERQLVQSERQHVIRQLQERRRLRHLLRVRRRPLNRGISVDWNFALALLGVCLVHMSDRTMLDISPEEVQRILETQTQHMVSPGHGGETILACPRMCFSRTMRRSTKGAARRDGSEALEK